jgi:hypothetical protein
MRASVVLVVALAIPALLASEAREAGTAEGAARAGCAPARVEYTRYPGGDSRLRGLPWVRGEPRSPGLVGLLWYWPREWHERRLRAARIFTDGAAPAGYSTKVLWVFLGRSAKNRGGSRLLVRGQRLDARGTFEQEFAAVFYSGQNSAPSYASIVDVPAAGCWRLRLSTASLRASVVVQAVRAPETPTPCASDEVETLVGGFVDAFNRGDAEALDSIFAREPDFEWYSTGPPGARLDPVARDRPSLVPYFRDRHALDERLELESLTFNGNTTGARTYGNFVYALDRSAADLPTTSYRGKGAALCYHNRRDVIFVWSMAPAP